MMKIDKMSLFMSFLLFCTTFKWLRFCRRQHYYEPSLDWPYCFILAWCISYCTCMHW